jgi:type IV secretory pathway VirB2 component (pilin)
MLGGEQGCLMHFFLASFAPGSGSLADPAGPSVIVAAMAWVQGALLGTVATVVAVIAVAWVGMLMLAGRINVRRGLTVIVGCFILFGASSIAGGLRTAANGSPAYATPDAAPPPPTPPPPETPPANRDPYAGAAVPAR